MTTQPKPQPATVPQDSPMPHGTGLPLTITAFMILSLILSAIGGAADRHGQSELAIAPLETAPAEIVSVDSFDVSAHLN